MSAIQFFAALGIAVVIVGGVVVLAILGNFLKEMWSRRSDRSYHKGLAAAGQELLNFSDWLGKNPHEREILRTIGMNLIKYQHVGGFYELREMVENQTKGGGE